MAKVKKKDTFEAIVKVGYIPKEERATTGIRPEEPEPAPTQPPLLIPELPKVNIPSTAPLIPPTMEPIPPAKPTTPEAGKVTGIKLKGGEIQAIKDAEKAGLISSATANAFFEKDMQGTITDNDISVINSYAESLTSGTTKPVSADPNAVTAKQIKYLKGLGVAYSEGISKWEASALLTKAIADAEVEGGTTPATSPATTGDYGDPYAWKTGGDPATSAQLAYLKGLKIAHDPAITKAQASVLLKSAIEAQSLERAKTEGTTPFTAGSIETKELSRDEVRDIIEKHFGISAKNIRDMDELFENVDYQEALNFVKGNSREAGLKKYLNYIYNGVGGPDMPEGETIVTQPKNIGKTDIKNISGDLKDVSFVEHIAVLGLTPAAVIGNSILAGYEIIIGSMVGGDVTGIFKKADAAEMAQTWFGKALGLGTAGAIIANIWSAGSAIAALGYLTKGGLIGTVATVFAANTFVLEPSELATWAAVDNIASATSFQINQISYGHSQGLITDEEALDLINLAQRNINEARKYVDTTTMYNPKLWPSRAILIQAIQTAEDTVNVQRIKMGL